VVHVNCTITVISSFCSRALLNTSLFVESSWQRVWVRVGIDTFTLWHMSSCSWISSKYTVCAWGSSDAKWLRCAEIEEGTSISVQSVLLKPLQ
jgi:hypothetical protein